MIRSGKKNTIESCRYIRAKEGGNEEVKMSELLLHSSNSDKGWDPNGTPCKFLRMLGTKFTTAKNCCGNK
jgi:hypothetical protein